MFVLTFEAYAYQTDGPLLPLRLVPAEDVGLVLAQGTALRRPGRYRLHKVGEGVPFEVGRVGKVSESEAETLARRAERGAWQPLKELEPRWPTA